MEKYDYRSAVLEDVKSFVKDNVDMTDFDTRDELEEHLNEELFVADSVTGNASGSYAFSTWKAEEYLCHNRELLEDACSEFGESIGDVLEKGAESADVTIRCYLLNECISQALDELWVDRDEEEEE